MEALQEAHRRNEKRDPPSLLVFPGRNGYLGDIREGLNHACDRAGIARVTVHQLRHTCASLMVMNGSDLPSVAATLGHRDITTTMIYAHLTQDHIKSQMGKLDGVSVPAICPKSAQNSLKVKKENPSINGIPFGIAMVPKAGFEPARVSPPPPQDGVSASSTTSARCRKNILIHAPLENQGEESGGGVRQDRRRTTRSHPANSRLNVFLPKPPASLYSFPGNLLP